MYFFWHKPEFKQRIRDRLHERGHKRLARRLLDDGTPQRDFKPSKPGRGAAVKRGKFAKKKATSRGRAQRGGRR